MTLEAFAAADLRVGTITNATRVEGSEKMLRLTVDLGELDSERQILSGIGRTYDPATLVGRQGVFIVNLEPRMIMGLESRGMLLATDNDGAPVLLQPDSSVVPGSSVH